MNDIARHMNAVARRLLGTPNEKLSTGREWRYGTHGSLSVNVEKGVWHDHESGEGGGVLDLIARELKLHHSAAFDWLRDALGIESDQASTPPRQRNSKENRTHKAAWLWWRRRTPEASPVGVYLRSCRRYFGLIPPTIAFLPPLRPDHHTAMIAAFGMADELEPGVLRIPEDRVRAVHLTFLRADGSNKAGIAPNKIMIGAVKGSPIVLAPPNDLLGLAITEGIEDGLSVYRSTGLGVWAAGSAGFMSALADVIPSYVEAVSIYAHSDEAGQRGAQQLAARLHNRRHRAEVAILELVTGAP